MIRILSERIEPDELKRLCDEYFISFVKFVADVKKGIIAVGGELHSDAESELISQGSNQRDIWGANFYPYKPPEKRIEYTALINIRPRDDNPSMEIKDRQVRIEIKKLAEKLILSYDDSVA